MDNTIPLGLANWAFAVRCATLLLHRTEEGHVTDRLIGAMLLASLAPCTGEVTKYVPRELWEPLQHFWDAGAREPGIEERLYQEFQTVAQPLFT